MEFQAAPQLTGMGTVDLSEFAGGNISLDAVLIAEDLGLAPAQVLERLRAGSLTARCEQGIGEDAGRLRLTFYHESRRLQLIVDQGGRILQRSAVQLRRRDSKRPAPGSSNVNGGTSV